MWPALAKQGTSRQRQLSDLRSNQQFRLFWSVINQLDKYFQFVKEMLMEEVYRGRRCDVTVAIFTVLLYPVWNHQDMNHRTTRTINKDNEVKCLEVMEVCYNNVWMRSKTVWMVWSILTNTILIGYVRKRPTTSISEPLINHSAYCVNQNLPIQGLDKGMQTTW